MNGPHPLSLLLEDTTSVGAREPLTAHALVSIAISLKRIADNLAPFDRSGANINDILWSMLQDMERR